MFGIGFSELVLIALVVVIFIRPEDLPAFFRKLGKIFRETKKAYDELTQVKDDFIKNIESSITKEEQEEPKRKSPPDKGEPKAADGDISITEDSGESTESKLKFSKHRPAATEGVPAASIIAEEKKEEE